MPAAELVERLAARARAAPRPVVLIDGGSGSGKSTLARALAPQLDAQLVRLDDIYPGWDGLEAGSRAVAEQILDPTAPGWRRWDWAAGESAEWRPLDRDRPLVVEGSGTLSRSNRALSTLGIWVELDAVERRRRALERDGESYAPHWERWAAQERAFAERERPRALADEIVEEIAGESRFAI